MKEFAPLARIGTLVASLLFLSIARSTWRQASQVPKSAALPRYPSDRYPPSRWVYLAEGVIWFACGSTFLAAVVCNKPGICLLSAPFFLFHRALHPFDRSGQI